MTYFELYYVCMSCNNVKHWATVRCFTLMQETLKRVLKRTHTFGWNLFVYIYTYIFLPYIPYTRTWKHFPIAMILSYVDIVTVRRARSLLFQYTLPTTCMMETLLWWLCINAFTLFVIAVFFFPSYIKPSKKPISVCIWHILLLAFVSKQL